MFKVGLFYLINKDSDTFPLKLPVAVTTVKSITIKI